MSGKAIDSARPRLGLDGSQHTTGRGWLGVGGRLLAAWLCSLAVSLGCSAAAFGEGAVSVGGPGVSALEGPLVGPGGPNALVESSEPAPEEAFAAEGSPSALRPPDGIEPYSKHPSETRPYDVCPAPTATRASCLAIGVPSPSKLASLGLATPSYEGSGELEGLSPEDLRSAYKFPKEGGEGQTVAIVDAYNYANAQADLEVYRKKYGLPKCAEEVGKEASCFRKVNQKGEEGKPPAEESSEWVLETALDLDMVSASCPKCHILLVEANNAKLENLLLAVQEAAVKGAKVISDSWGSPESSGEAGDDHYLVHAGVPVLFGSGDSGYGVGYPSASPDVIAVGGTSLKRAKNSREWSEEAWSGAGSGCSRYEIEKPAWQTDVGCSDRTVADVSAVASPETPVSLYDSYGTKEEKGEKKGKEGWRLLGGTSVATPLVAGIEAQASKYALSLPAADVFYFDPGALFDVTSGSNMVEGEPCRAPAEDPVVREYECHAGVGYDGPTGNGTPDGLITVTSLPPLAVTRPAASVTGTTATLDGVLDPQGFETKYLFEYGTSTKYGSRVPVSEEVKAGSGTATQEVSEPITGLAASTTYHYRVVATSSAGVTHGQDGVFRSAVPTVTGVAPGTGQAAGGTTMTIGGSNFVGVSAVRFGSVEAESFKVESETRSARWCRRRTAGSRRWKSR